MKVIKEVIDGEDPFQAFLDGIENDVGSKIFTFKILETTKEGLESVIVFENKQVLYGHVKAGAEGSKMGLRLQANFI